MALIRTLNSDEWWVIFGTEIRTARMRRDRPPTDHTIPYWGTGIKQGMEMEQELTAQLC